MTLLTNDTRDTKADFVLVKSEKWKVFDQGQSDQRSSGKICYRTKKFNVKKWEKIREPQWKNITFATSMKMNDGAPSAAENIFQAWENFLAAQRVKIASLKSAKRELSTIYY